MLGMIVTLFVASLLGSLHCVGMCGPFLAFAVGGGGGSGAGRGVAGPHIAYHLGRLITYSLLGAVAGSVGAALDLSAGAFGFARGAMILASISMIGFGLVSLLQIAGVRVSSAPLPPGARRFVMWGHRHALKMQPVHRAGVLGLLSTLLPCGWLYAFAFAAAGTASPGWGAVAMTVFWFGTLPALLAFGAGLQALAGALRKRIPLLTATTLIAVGTSALIQRNQLNPAIISSRAHTAAASPVDGCDLAPAVHVPDPARPPSCCHP
ncbi:MAG: sulfite exporter TauE/SafE family protein [Phycisphaerae bacterium]